MPKKIVLEGKDKYIDMWDGYRRAFIKERGEFVDDTGSHIPKTTYHDIYQLVLVHLREYNRSRTRHPGHDDEIHQIFAFAVLKVRRQMKDADPDALYPANKWIWFDVLKKLVIHLDQMDNPAPNKTALVIESIKEAIDDRIGDARELVEGAADAAGAVLSSVGDAAEAVADTGKSVWTAVKVVAVVGAVGIGAAIVVPPIVRAVRDRGRDRDHDQQQTEDFHP